LIHCHFTNYLKTAEFLTKKQRDRMDVFALRDHLIQDYYGYISSFIQIRDPRLRSFVNKRLGEGLLWPDPLIQLNPAFEPGHTIDELVDEGLLHKACKKIFRRKSEEDPDGKTLRLHKHQEDAIRTARTGNNYILTTGTGSGKSLAYIIPIVDYVLQHPGKGIKAIIVYPMNALANSQMGELGKFLKLGFPDQKPLVTFERYTGQEKDEEKNRIMASPPDILLTNYVMLELILTRPKELNSLVTHAQGLRFLVLDELHTYRGRQGADVAMLVRRVRNALNASSMQCIGTSATLASAETIAGQSTQSFAEQKQEISRVASMLFGDRVKPEHIIGETLRRSTPEHGVGTGSPDDRLFLNRLTQRVSVPQATPTNFKDLCQDPLASWIESNLGLTTDPENGKLGRARPRSLAGKSGAARQLSEETGIPENRCTDALTRQLMAGYNIHNPDTGLPTFAFRLHQFISRGDTVYASLEPEEERYHTVHGQQYVPGDRGKVLLPLAFCRECGQEYYVVRRVKDPQTGLYTFIPRELSEHPHDENGEMGFLHFSSDNPWPTGDEEVVKRLPEDWLEEFHGEMRLRSAQRRYLPQNLEVEPGGVADPTPALPASGDGADASLQMQFLPAPFRFCLRCGVMYGSRQQSDFAKLTGLSSGGRSTDTTILSLSLLQTLRNDLDLKKEARKLLSFTDNRQDASLQAGHFNDFIEITLLRAALYRAVEQAGEAGIRHETLAQEVFDAFQLGFSLFAANPEARFGQKENTLRAMREVLGYRVYRDLKRGWRLTSPNLEQCGLLEISYVSLQEVCEADDLWEKAHPALASAPAETRIKVSKVLLDFMRRSLAIKVDYLDPVFQDGIVQQSSQYLKAPWGLDEDEGRRLTRAAVLYPRSRGEREQNSENAFLSSRGGFGQYLRNYKTTFPEYPDRINIAETAILIQNLLDALQVGDLVKVVDEVKNGEGVNGYQIPASAMIWKAGDGRKAFHDPISVPRLPEEGGRTNPFFVEFYRAALSAAGDASNLIGLEAHEHTAQVPGPVREERETRFRSAALPILFCSPTMELGVDIAELNAVNMRNVPPTPANYAQRSGRAGRQGQPALVFTYATLGSPHDQYYFKRPGLMVSGAVAPPRLDLANEDLVRSHVHAIWLAESGLDLGLSLKELLDLSGDPPTLELLDQVQHALHSETYAKKARVRAQAVLNTVSEELAHADWYNEDWLESVFKQLPIQFDQACQRWKTLYRAAKGQQKAQQKIIDDHSRSKEDHDQARRLRQEAESQIELLTEAENIMQSDFYSYRYFASEGFLPGYSFPRLPLSAYIPARRMKAPADKNHPSDEFLSRPRFLAISEFGPRAIIYHEGSRYTIHKVNLPVNESDDSSPSHAPTQRAKQCPGCGYFHPITAGDGLDLCERCNAPLNETLTALFRLQNVSTRRRDRISSDEEERMRQGFDLRTAVRFHELAPGQLAAKTARLVAGGKVEATVSYASSAALWRINLGWKRRAPNTPDGFLLDVERGYWAKQSDQEEEAGIADDPMSPRVQRVIPFVEDTKNCLLFEPESDLDEGQMASLQAALKAAIQVRYQLEDNELAAEPLPSADERRLILFYEAAEGGAGALRRLLDTPQAFAEVAQEALRLCHFDPLTGKDLRHAPNANGWLLSAEECEAACYDCLMSYFNQSDHRRLDRQAIKETLQALAQAEAQISPTSLTRAEHLQQLRNLCQSDLERHWLDYLEQHHYNLPSHAQKFIESCQTRPDFFYEKENVAIYIDGYHHLFPERQDRDQKQEECMGDMGYTVIRFGMLESWEANFARYLSLFGNPERSMSG
jgi:ATP-dependent helicase YprA (DUF1998 family)/very-short-patch-repair endonuclease